MDPKEERYWYIRTPDEVLKELDTTKKGLSHKQAQERIEEYGPNSLVKEEGLKHFKNLLDKCNNLIVYVLLVTAIISLWGGHAVEFWVILFIIAFTVLLGFFQEYHAGKSIEALQALTAKKVLVIREGKEQEIPAEQLVPGDIVSLKRGVIVPADIRILESQGLSVDESILTGESLQKHKIIDRLERQDAALSEQDNMVFSGTSVTSGRGLGVVVETGFRSEIGKISLALKSIDTEKSPLQKKVHVMSKRISFFIVAAAALFYFILLAQDYSTAAALLLVGAVAVAGIPEGFPLVMTLTLSHGVKRMAKQNAIVKDLSSVETLGTTTVICTDKTGTLTENKMRVKKLWLPQKELVIEGVGYEPKSTFTDGKKMLAESDLKEYETLFHTAALCNNSDLMFSNGDWTLKGEPTEGALITLAKSAGFDEEVLRETHPRVHEVPFDPAQKFMITVHKQEGKKTFVAHLKGAPEKVLEKCTHYNNGKKLSKLSPKERKIIQKAIQDYSKEALRVLALATKNTKTKDAPETGYTFEGFVGIKDPIRKDVYDAVKECHQAGVRIIMVTGDHVTTATAIGRELGLVTKVYDKVLTGADVDKLNDEDLDKEIPRVAIFARTTPEHKLRIVHSLQRTGEITAMTGDGVNDAPALKKADIGVAMGKDGTDVARESANIVLADDNFATIVHAIREGRTIYANIRRFIYYLLTANFTEVSLIIFAVALGFAAPMTALMILFINVITSVVPAFALSVEPTHDKVMQQHPRSPNEKLLSSYILLKIGLVVPIIFLGTFILFFWEIGRSELAVAQTVAFASIVLFELFHVFNARSLHITAFNKNFFSNKWIFISIAVSLALMLGAIYTTAGQTIFGTVPLTGTQLLIIAAAASTVLLISELTKLAIKSEFAEQSQLQGVDFNVQ